MGHFENDRLAAALRFVVGRGAENDVAAGNPHLAVALLESSNSSLALLVSLSRILGWFSSQAPGGNSPRN